MKNLFFFTSSYPYGFGESWKETELLYFSRQFDVITIIPFNYAGNKKSKAVPDNVQVAFPVITDFASFKKDFFKLFFSKYLLFYLGEFFSKKVYLDKKWFKTWLVSSVWMEKMRRHVVIKKLLTDKNFGVNSVLYFFWARENAFIISFLEQHKFRKIVVRFHGYDLYEERDVNNGYIPYRRQMFEKITDGIFVSQNGLEYLTKKYLQARFKKHLFRLGSKVKGIAVSSRDNVFRIYTCSMMIPVKRLHLLAEALCKAKIQVEWHHIGNGSERDRVLSIVAEFPMGTQFIEHGFIKPEKVLDEYENTPADLFINVSESEGVPVSIMEALSAGIPVLATNVGGTSEIVNPDVGILINKDITAGELWEELYKFYNLPEAVKKEKRLAAREYFFRLWDAEKNSEAMSKFLSN